MAANYNSKDHVQLLYKRVTLPYTYDDQNDENKRWEGRPGPSIDHITIIHPWYEPDRLEVRGPEKWLAFPPSVHLSFPQIQLPQRTCLDSKRTGSIFQG